jgi:hypothetical protein
MTQTQLEKEPLPLQGSKVYLGRCSYSNVALSSPSPWPLFHNYFVWNFHLGTRICSILGNFWEINKSVVISRDFLFFRFKMAPLDKPVSMVLQSFSNFSTISTSFYHYYYQSSHPKCVNCSCLNSIFTVFVNLLCQDMASMIKLMQLHMI